MNNSFQQWQEEQWGEDGFDGIDEIENNLIQQIETFSFFGKVIELFIPNAISTATKMIGGEGSNKSAGGIRRKSPESFSGDWRKPPTNAPGRK